MMPTIPVTLLTGFLGAGKTTLLNRLLAEGALADAALIINEFGDIGIDHLLVETVDEGIVELSDGCLCCTIRGDLVDTLTRLMSLDADRVPGRNVIESTGLADPAPILQAVMGHPLLDEALRLDGVIGVVDALHGDATLHAHDESVKQVAMADRIVLTKLDLDDTAQALRHRIEGLNPGVPIIEPDDGQPLANRLFDCGLYNPDTRSADVRRWLREEEVRHAHGHHHHHDINRHDRHIRAYTMASDRSIDAASLETFIDLLSSAHGASLLRVKGIFRLRETPDQPVVIHGVQGTFHPPARLPHWPEDDHRSRLVMIAKDMPETFARGLFDALMGEVRADTPDREALANNPLVIPGMPGSGGLDH